MTPDIPFEAETPDGRHRRWLERQIPEVIVRNLFAPAGAKNTGTLLWVMLNPSVASAEQDDPTVRRVIRFTRDAGYARLLVGNLFARRAIDPRELDAADPDSNLPDADETLASLAAVSDAIVLAWGAAAGVRDRAAFRRRAAHVRQLLAATGKPLYALGWTAGKTEPAQPRHPLFVRASARLHPIPEIVK